jgi:hypothetical protein
MGAFVLACAFGQDPVKPATGEQAAAQPATQTAAQPAPAKPAVAVDTDENSEDFSIGISGWYNPAKLRLRNGKGAVVGDNPANLDYPGKLQPMPGITISTPAGKYNALRFSYLRSTGHGASVLGSDIKTFGQDFVTGDTLSVDYKVQIGKVSWEYLSWPYPPKESSLRLKTLWQAQFISIKSELDAPFYDAANSTSTFATKSQWFIYPTIGLGLEKRFSKNFRWELQASGFTLPHRAAIGDAETFFSARRGRVEVQFGAKYYYIKTSPKRDAYITSQMPGAFVEIRYHPAH